MFTNAGTAQNKLEIQLNKVDDVTKLTQSKGFPVYAKVLVSKLANGNAWYK